MKRTGIPILTGLCALLSLAAGSVTSKPSSLLIPTASKALIDVHESHGKRDIACVQCHPAAANSRRASDRLVPTKADCAVCHAEASALKDATDASGLRCKSCHVATSPDTIRLRSIYPEPRIQFSHKAHGQTPCESCHGDMTAGASRPFQMRECFDCHRRGSAATTCRTCHLTHPDGRMISEFDNVRMYPPKWLAGPNHGAQWQKTHGPSAGANQKFCSNCHTEKYCTDCHVGRASPSRNHPPDWMTAHGVSSRIDRKNCSSCHRSQSFCIDCHRRSGRSPDAPTAVRGAAPGNYHKGRAPADICRRARTDLNACVSCHTESSCIRCHGRINPHPAGFSRRCRNLARQNAAACGKCHTTSPVNRCQ